MHCGFYSPTSSSLLSPCQLSLSFQSAPPLALWLPPWQAPTTLWPWSSAAASMIEVLNMVHTGCMSSLQADEKWNHSGQTSLCFQTKTSIYFTHWACRATPQKPDPTHLLTVQPISPECPDSQWMWLSWNKVIHWALALFALVQWTHKRHVGLYSMLYSISG